MLTILRRYFAGRIWLVAAMVVLADLFVVALVGVSLEASYKQYLERSAITSRNTNRLVSQSIEGEIDRIDMGLRAVQDEYSRLCASGRIDPQGLTSFLRRQQERLPMVDSLRIADAHGNVLWGADKTLPAGISIADRDYFVAVSRGDSKRLAISKPLLSRVNGKWVLVFARSLSCSNESFDGVVYSPVTIEWFNQKFAKLEVGPRGAVVLRGDASRDFDLLARFPQAGFVGQTKVSQQFTAMITVNPKGGTYEAYAGADNIRRTFSYQPIGNYPLITLVGLSTEDTLAEWWREVVKLASLTAAFLVLTALGGWMVLRAWNARAQAYEEVRSINEELERDNAARRQAEAEIARLNANLEQRVHERTAELEAANKELEAFSYSVSHDLRGPLRHIDGFLGLLKGKIEPTLDEESRHYMATIADAALRMAALIDDLLSFSRTGRFEMNKSQVDLGELVREVIKEFEPEAQGRAVVWRIGELPVLAGDRAMLRVVLVNLISNALKFTQPRARTEIGIGCQPSREGETVVFVRDNGVGFDMKYADKLFGVFERLHDVDEFEGTGIGLANVRRIIDRHGGTTWAEGKVDGGATFYFSLPQS